MIKNNGEKILGSKLQQNQIKGHIRYACCDKGLWGGVVNDTIFAKLISPS